MTETTPEIYLTDEQQSAVETLSRLGKRVQTLGGLGGTGKTTIVRSLIERLPNFAVCAYTGKAAQVLRRKGVMASTIHSLIYRPVGDGDDVTFELQHPDEFDRAGVIVDEASMVGQDIYSDLKSLDVPLIFIGDHGQLEPVGGGDFNLMKEPDIILEKIHRNAGEIAIFADHLRQGRDPHDWQSDGRVQVMTAGALEEHGAVGEADQIICAYNRTRVEVNSMARTLIGREGAAVIGDRVMCLQNDRKLGVFNGMQGVITEISRNWLTFDDGERQYRVPYLSEAFGAEKKPEYRRGVIPFDWCYCITAHKSQGDEFDNVLVIEQRCDLWDHTRWAYTAASRAKKQLTWVLEN